MEEGLSGWRWSPWKTVVGAVRWAGPWRRGSSVFSFESTYYFMSCSYLAAFVLNDVGNIVLSAFFLPLRQYLQHIKVACLIS